MAKQTQIVEQPQMPQTLNLKAPDLFVRLFEAADKRSLPDMSLCNLVRIVLTEWIDATKTKK